MPQSTAYYSIIQYCPNPARAEAANIGVLLFNPAEKYVEARLSQGNRRIERFFGRGSFSREKLNARKRSFENALRISANSLATVEEFVSFLAQFSNELRPTPPKPILVQDSVEELAALYDELVGGTQTKSDKKQREAREKIDGYFKRPSLQGKVVFDQSITIPKVHRSIEIPYSYQNGATNLIKPEFFATTAQGVNKALQLSSEWDLFRRHCSGNGHGEYNLIVISVFNEPVQGIQQNVTTVADVLTDFGIDHVSDQDIDEFIQRVEAEAR